jgi:tetratricopeptide (TPR) repeat protein
MRALWIAGLAVEMSLLASPSLRAGVYNTAEPDQGPASVEGSVSDLYIDRFLDVFLGLSNISNELQGSEKRVHYLAKKDELERKLQAGAISLEERVNLSAYLQRLRKYDEASQVLEPAVAEGQKNFMIFANLATAQEQAGRSDRAIYYQTQLLKFWPAQRPGFTQEHLDWYQKVETYYQDLLKLRQRETALQGGARPRSPTSLDDLFKQEVHFVGESGKYEAGKLAAKERAKLPKDAVAIVQQLLVWTPDDTRLLWLLGELYNSQGEISAADKIFNICGGWNRGLTAPEFKAHRQLVFLAAKEVKPKTLEIPITPTPQTGASETQSDQGAASDWRPDTRTMLIVGIVAGLVVAFLAYLQIRVMRKR